METNVTYNVQAASREKGRFNLHALGVPHLNYIYK